jgi:uncharacterized protein
MEKKIAFVSEDNRLEGIYAQGSNGKGVVITHPHPLYGGDMHNGVVESIADAYREKGYSTLRFNFRGVGASDGAHDDGNGEQEDVLAARAYLEQTGIEQVDLVGYSFGAWVNARVGCGGSADGQMVMVSPPVAFIDYSAVGRLPCLKLVVAGSRDAYAPTGQIRNMLPGWNDGAVFKIIEGADHFYGGHLKKLESILEAFI